MPRKARVISSTGIYHIVLRAVNQQQLFIDDEDHNKFLYILSDYSSEYNISIYAYCLMSNHIHLLINTHSSEPDAFMRSFNTRFVMWYNKKYERSGHLYQDRFYSQPVESEIQFLRTIAYIHENPVKATLCRYASEYKWSSCMAYYGKKDPLINPALAASLVGTIEDLRSFFSSFEYEASEASYYEIQHEQKRISEDKALVIFHETTNCTSPSDFQKLPQAKRKSYIYCLKEAGLNTSQIARFCGQSRQTVYRTLKCYTGTVPV